jgi:sterol desaturase/sphingolipid hydroxylase (fatty acid hydroxylase superfamily)
MLWFHGLKLGGSVFLAAALLELTVLTTVKDIITKTEGGRSLYAMAWLYNAINHLCLAPCVYTIGMNLYASAEPCSLTVKLMYATATIGIHSIGYYLTHRAMHTKALWWAHRYHHKFNTFICPIAAAAVTQVLPSATASNALAHSRMFALHSRSAQTEYFFAYMIPFIMAGSILQPVPVETIAIAGLAIGHVNNLIHYAPLEGLSVRYVPWLGVSTADHFEHHRKLTSNYAAPTLNVDRLVCLSPALERLAARVFGAAFGKPVGVMEPPSKSE